MKRSCCKLLTRTVTNTPNPDTYVSHLFRCLFICVVEKVCSSFFFSLLLSYSFRNYLGTPVFFIYIKRALFLLVQTCMICYPGGIQWSVELVFGENSKHHSRTRVKCTRLVLFITTGGRLDGDIIWGLLLRTAGHF